MGREIKPHKCGWCLAGEHEKCRPEYVFEGRVYDCMCAHPVTQSEWLGYHVDVDGRPE